MVTLGEYARLCDVVYTLLDSLRHSKGTNRTYQHSFFSMNDKFYVIFTCNPKDNKYRLVRAQGTYGDLFDSTILSVL